MANDNRSITILKDEETLSFLISMLSSISKAGSDREVTSEGNQVIIRQRTPSEITTLDRDVSGLRAKIFDWFDARTSLQPLTLDEAESDLFRYCVHAAYYFITEEEKPPVNQQFIDFYERYFK